MIADTHIKGAASSCACGKHNRLMEAAFKGVSIEQLMHYGAQRIIQKTQQ